MTIYLDHNATTPRLPEVVEAMLRAERDLWGNPASIHSQGRKARKVVEDTREQLAALLGRSARDVVFTGGGTEANHLALAGAGQIVTSRIEHPSVTAQAEMLAETNGCIVEFAQVSEQGVVTAEAIEAALDLTEERARGAGAQAERRSALLVAVMGANHETGVIQPLSHVARIAHARGARLHVDAVQLLGRADLAPLSGADSLAGSAHKFGGPKGLGFLAFDCGWVPSPVGRGGGQERGLRPGTVNVSAVAGLAAALSHLQRTREGFARAAAHRQALEQALRERALVPISIHGGQAARLGHVLNFRVQGYQGDELVAALDLAGICVSSGSACSAGSTEPSEVISAMLGREAARGALRVSLGPQNTIQELQRLLCLLAEWKIIRPDD